MDLDRRVFIGVSNSADGEVSPETRFSYRQQDEVVWADYRGGDVIHGHLVGTRTGDRLVFRYVHLNTGGETAAGRCTSHIEVLPDGRLRLHEEWAWESRPGTGTSVVEQEAIV